METHTRGPVVIEFNGLPGCGKTTTARALRDTFAESHYSSVFSYYKSSWFRKKIGQLFWYKNIRLLIRLLRLALSQKNFFASLPGVLAICRYNQMYNMFAQNGEDILIIDQGIVQGFLSMSHTNAIANIILLDKIARHLHFKDLSLIMVNCDISVKESLKRIKERQTNGGRLDKMSFLDLVKALRVQDNNLQIIRSCIMGNIPLACITINTHDTVKDNVEKIIRLYNELQ